MALAKGIAGSNFYAMINGQSGGYLTSATIPTIEVDKITVTPGPDGVSKMAGGRPKFGKAKVVTNISEANALWQLIESVMKKNCQEFDAAIGVADHNYKSVRECNMSTCLIDTVSFSNLKSDDGKGLFEVTAEFQCQDVKWDNGNGAVIKGNLSNKAKGWHKSFFVTNGLFGGIPSQCVTEIALAKHTAKIVTEHLGQHRLPTLNYGPWTIEGLKVSGSHAYGGYEAARDFAVKTMYDGVLQESEFVDWSVDIKAPNHKDTVGTVTFIQTAPQKFTVPEYKGGDDKPMPWSFDCFIEQQFMQIVQKA